MLKKTKGTKLGEWQQIRTTGECARCHRGQQLTVDHIIPVGFLTQTDCDFGIYDDEENFELICRTCNSFKANRIDISHPKTVQLLKQYVNMLDRGKHL